MGAPKVHICKIETKKHKANAFLAYFSAFLTFALVVCLIVSALTLFEFSGHFWRGGLLLCIFLLFLFSAWFQWEVNPTLQTNEKGQVVYSYQETIKAMGNNTITYEFIRVDKIKYKAKCLKKEKELVCSF